MNKQLKELLEKSKQEEICTCPCHNIENGIYVMHCMPCCSLCGDRYLNTDGTINEEVLEKLLTTKFTYSKGK